jgi:periplasmic protein TonB
MKKIFLVLILFVANNAFAQNKGNVVSATQPKEPITTSSNEEEDSAEGMIFQRVEVESEFPGGRVAWKDYLEKNLKSDVPEKNKAKPGQYTVIIKFTVNKDGELNDIVPETNVGYGMEQEVIRILKKSPKWKPGIQNGQVVKSLKRQPVTFVVL